MASPSHPNIRDSSRIRRRSFLALVGTNAIALASGCTDEIRDRSFRPKLGWVAIKNYHPEPQRFEVQILREETVVHDSNHEIEGKTEGRIPGDVLECTWGDDPGSYTLRGRLADGEWVERSVTRATDDSASIDETTECVIAEGAYARYGSHQFTWMIQDWCEEVPTYDGGCSFANSDS